ncbi:HEPN domain-containing protein [Mycolicibacterium peregrinum]|uniref:HEPN domain-containing protein n=1 Tax=Mycolicibacterium peregrinum TaxID=43304 RepID=UPI001041FFF4|nr:HEPN domain-containing protein [Mycolicibacterium peregrinum]
MASQSRQSFDKNSADIERLLAIHGDITGSARGRRYGVEVLNKAAVVLITAIWEAYCEDIAAEGLRSIVENAPSAVKLPKELQKTVASELKKEDHDLAIWNLAGEGWRQVLRDRLDRILKNEQTP